MITFTALQEKAFGTVYKSYCAVWGALKVLY